MATNNMIIDQTSKNNHLISYSPSSSIYQFVGNKQQKSKVWYLITSRKPFKISIKKVLIKHVSWSKEIVLGKPYNISNSWKREAIWYTLEPYRMELNKWVILAV